jgi:hypothetical protein
MDATTAAPTPAQIVARKIEELGSCDVDQYKSLVKAAYGGGDSRCKIEEILAELGPEWAIYNYDEGNFAGLYYEGAPL